MKTIGLDYLGTLEGFKSKFKELHWTADSMVQHKLCDEVLDTLDGFQDSFAEELFGIYGKPSIGEFVAKPKLNQDIPSALNEIFIETTSIREVIESEGNEGLLAITDEFIHSINKFIYLANFK